MNTTLVGQAEALARRAHEGQERKGGAPYIVHPERVAGALQAAGFDELTIAAGWLHDTLEDTAISEAEIAELNPELPTIIRAVTEDGSLSWVERKRAFTDALRNGPDRSKAVACADRIDNLTNFLADYKTVGPDLWKRWPERAPQDKIESDRYFLAMLKETWESPLLDKLEALVEQESQLHTPTEV